MIALTIKSLIRRFCKAVASAVCAVALLPVAYPIPAQAQQLLQLGVFNGFNGNGPNPRLVMDTAGNLYGTAYYGGISGPTGPGTVFKLSRYGSTWLMTTLYEFRGHADGGNPWGGVVIGPDGVLYGATYAGGSHNAGTVYKLQPPENFCRTAICYWNETVLYNFTGAPDGSGPQGDLAFDSAGNLYGTTEYGGQGPFSGQGVVYRLSPSQGGWNETVLYAFPGGAAGRGPQDGVVIDRAGNLYGVAAYDAAYLFGAVYELSNSHGAWTETVLHSFAGGSSDGNYPAGLTIDGAGNLYGETGQGGANNAGTAYQLRPANGGFSYNIIFNYNTDTGSPFPVVSLTPDRAGDLYGCNVGGAQGALGTAFQLMPAQGSWNFNPLFYFDQLQGWELNCTPLLDSEGDMFGTAYQSGPYSYGTVWELTP
jgi:uncharacterized repeat protein (TIGR03803 family)